MTFTWAIGGSVTTIASSSVDVVDSSIVVVVVVVSFSVDVVVVVVVVVEIVVVGLGCSVVEDIFCIV